MRAHLGAYFRSILTNAASEYQNIEASERGDKGAELPTDAIDEQINRLLRSGRAAGQ